MATTCHMPPIPNLGSGIYCHTLEPKRSSHHLCRHLPHPALFAHRLSHSLHCKVCVALAQCYSQAPQRSVGEQELSFLGLITVCVCVPV